MVCGQSEQNLPSSIFANNLHKSLTRKFFCVNDTQAKFAECCEQDILLLNIIIWWYVFIGLQVAQASIKPQETML